MFKILAKLFKDKTEVAIFLSAFLLEIVFGLYLIQRWGYTFSSGDDISQVYKARVIMDNGSNSGLGALGAVWLPVFQILLMPLVLMDSLYTTGFAGTIINALATAGICVILFRMLESTYLKVVGILLFLCNVFTLVYGSVPMNVQLTLLFIVLGAYYFKHYWEKDEITEFLKCSLVLILASLTRYEGWAATLLVMFLFVLKELKGRHYYRLAYTHIPAWGIFAGVFWNMALFRDPLSFLSHPLHATAKGWVLPYAWSLELTTINVINAISVISGPLWIIPVLSLPILLMKKRDSKFITSLILLTPIFSHWLLIYTNVSVGSIRFFYLGYVGLVLTPLLALDSIREQNTPRCDFRRKNPYKERQARVAHIIKKARIKPIILTLLACSLFYAYLTQIEVITLGTLGSYSFKFSSVDFQYANVVKGAVLPIKKVIGSGSAVLCPFDSVVSSELSVTGLSPSILFDGYDIEQAMANPWTKYDFVIIRKNVSDDELIASNNYFKSLYGINYYEYSYYNNAKWKEQFLTHYTVVLESLGSSGQTWTKKGSTVFRRISGDELGSTIQGG